MNRPIEGLGVFPIGSDTKISPGLVLFAKDIFVIQYSPLLVPYHFLFCPSPKRHPEQMLIKVDFVSYKQT